MFYINRKLMAAIIVIFLLAISFIGCPEPNKNNEEKITAEQAFEKVRQYYGNPETNSWNDGESEKDQIAFGFFKKNFTQKDLDNVLAYWDNLPSDGTFYGWRQGPYNYGSIDWELRFR